MEPPEDVRGRLLAIVRALPGASTREIAAQVGLAESTTAYHLDRMAREDALSSQVIGRARCWFAAPCGLCPVLRRSSALLRRPGFERIARALETTPQPARELAERAGVGKGTVRWVAGELARAHLAQRTRAGLIGLREGAEVCVAKATARERCTLWGKCVVSRAWRAALAGQPAPETQSTRGKA